MPFVLEVAASLTTFTNPNHIASLCSWGFALLSPCCNSNYFGYISDVVVFVETGSRCCVLELLALHRWFRYWSAY